MNEFLDRIIPKWYHKELLQLHITFMPEGLFLVELSNQPQGVVMRCAGTDCEFAVEKCINDYEAKYIRPTKGKVR